ncbi:DUF2066 domain-containing protein [Agaribacterium sp. ZY112]|uniref:DUF2066 domain-containing protein n=1 Tax=Agaribacterium sp. ZY112 TaxID=3233574 RepID=UPI00352504FC
MRLVVIAQWKNELNTYRNLILCLLCLLALTPSLRAADSSARYFERQLPVSSQAVKERQAAATHALMDVLVRISGTEDVRTNEQLLAKSKNALSYVEQFSYQQPSIESEQSDAFELKLSFAPSSVRALLADAQMPFWPVSRPSVLLWLVEDSAEYGRQVLMADEPGSEWAQSLELASLYRGLPLSFPLLDFQDQVALSVGQLWALDEQAILTASARYDAQLVLVGKLTRTSNGAILSSWEFFHQDHSQVYDARSEDIDAAMRSGIGPVADYLASQFSLNLDTEDYFNVEIDGVSSYRDYRAVMSVFEALEAVSEVRVQSLDQQLLRLSLVSEASREQLLGTLAMERSLEEQSADLQEPAFDFTPGSTLGSNAIRYHWQP